MENAEATPYLSLDDIRLRKAQLQTELLKESNHAHSIVDRMLHPKKDVAKKRGFASYLAAGATMVDGALFAWKLYRRLGGGKQLRLFRKK